MIGTIAFGLSFVGMSALAQPKQAVQPELQMFIERMNTELVRLRWTGSGVRTLQQKSDFTSAPWSDVLTTAADGTEVPSSGKMSAFRVRTSSPQEPNESKEATPATLTTNNAVLSQLPFDNQQDFADASRGLIAKPISNVITNSSGAVVWNLDQYSFLTGNVPSTVNPSLWRQARLNMNAGLFKVADRIYQVRGLDLANMSLIQGDTGWIVIDPLTCNETAAAAMDLVNKNLPPRPVVAIIFTHSHVDHFGGGKGVVSEADYNSGKVQVIAPEGFTEHAVSENVFAGNAMSRRAQYMYAPLLARGPKSQIDSGLGKTTASGTVSLLTPTLTITNTGQRVTIDGLDIVFQNVPGSEAPAEMMFYFPQLRALCLAEDATHTLHNLVTLRGALVRDALAWAKFLNDTIELFGSQTDVAFASHHWPTWGQDTIVNFLKKQRDIYKYLHDQTLRLLNQGYTPLEIAEMLDLPKSLSQEFYNRGYYGSVSHDIKAIYQRYIGWFDGNPAHLHELPPVETSKKYLEFMGGADAVLKKAQASYAAGDFRWVAQVVNHIVFAQPTNTVARQLQADALEQLGYQAESAPWRNFYLVGASELRNGVTNAPASGSNSDVLRGMPTDLLFDYFAIRLNGDRAEGKTLSLNWHFTDIKELFAMTVENSVLNYTKGKQLAAADVSITMTRSALNDLFLGERTVAQLVASGELQVEGRLLTIAEFLSLLDSFEFEFNIVTP
jgi:alkyl sulfatase BDS1-like metallo-beta-lactamase superfamily hydrolase